MIADRAGTLLAALLLPILVAPGLARAQIGYRALGGCGGGSQESAGYYITPCLSVGEEYDDNVFSTSSGADYDFISRFSPEIQVGYQSVPFTLLASYRTAADIYARNSQLNDALARQSAGLTASYIPEPRATLSLSGFYDESDSPRDLNLSSTLSQPAALPGSQAPPSAAPIPQATNLEARRGRAHLYSVQPSLSYRLTDRLTTTSGYGFYTSDQVGGSTNTGQTANGGLQLAVTPIDSASLAYTFNDFGFSGGSETGADNGTTSHVVEVGWTRQLSRRAAISGAVGPRFSNGSTTVEASADVTYLLERGSLSLSYERTQSTAIGQAGVINTQGVVGTISYQLLESLSTGVSLFFSRNGGQGSPTDVYGTTVSVSYPLSTWLSLGAWYEFTFQDGQLGVGAPTAGSSQDIYHNIVLIGTTVGFSSRVY